MCQYIVQFNLWIPASQNLFLVSKVIFTDDENQIISNIHAEFPAGQDSFSKITRNWWYCKLWIFHKIKNRRDHAASSFYLTWHGQSLQQGITIYFVVIVIINHNDRRIFWKTGTNMWCISKFESCSIVHDSNMTSKIRPFWLWYKDEHLLFYFWDQLMWHCFKSLICHIISSHWFVILFRVICFESLIYRIVSRY